MQESHCESVWSRASRDWWRTRKGSLFPSIGTGILGLLFLGLYRSWKVAAEEVDYVFAFLVPAASWALIAFIWHFLRAPYRQLDEVWARYQECCESQFLANEKEEVIGKLVRRHNEGQELLNENPGSNQINSWLKHLDNWVDLTKNEINQCGLNHEVPSFVEGISNQPAPVSPSVPNYKSEGNARKRMKVHLDNLAAIIQRLGSAHPFRAQ